MNSLNKLLKSVLLSFLLMEIVSQDAFSSGLRPLSTLTQALCEPVVVGCFQENLYEQQAPLFVTVNRVSKVHQNEEVCSILLTDNKKEPTLQSHSTPVIPQKVLPIIPERVIETQEALNGLCKTANAHESKEPAYAVVKGGATTCAAVHDYPGWNTYTWWYDGELDVCWMLAPSKTTTLHHP